MDNYGVDYLAGCISELQKEASEALYDTTRLDILERRENLLQALLWEIKNDSRSIMGSSGSSMPTCPLPGREVAAYRMAEILGFKGEKTWNS